MSRLDPAFRGRVELLLANMRALGFAPMIWEAHRSFERADALVKAGAGVHRSMHCYGLAVDIVHAKPPHWGAPIGFWHALRHESEALGMTSGASFHRVDLDHVQALPAAKDNWVRQATPAEIAHVVQAHFA